MSIDAPILVTGAAGRTGGVGGEIVNILRRRNLPVRRWSGPMTIAPRHFAQPGPRSLLATSPGSRTSPAPWPAAGECISA